MKFHAPPEIPPQPWSVRIVNGECWGINDANGDPVVITDSGYYPPNMETAQLIVHLINNLKDPT